MRRLSGLQAHGEHLMAKAKGNNKKTALIVVLIFMVVVLASGAVMYYLWANRPYVKASEAFDEGQYETVVELYGDIRKEEERKEIYDMLLIYATAADEDYYKEIIEYTEAVNIYELTKPILAGDRSYLEAVNHTELIFESREYFEKAERFFQDENYQEAMDTYALVSKEDERYYDMALEQIELCKEYLMTWLDGDYSLYVDAKELIYDELENMGVFADWASTNLSYPFYICLDLNEDGSGRLYLNKESFYEGHTVFVNELEEFVYDYAKQEYGYSEMELKLFVAIMGYDTVLDYVLEDAGESRESISADALLNDMCNGETEFSFFYRYVDDKLYCSMADDITGMNVEELNIVAADGSTWKFDVVVSDESISIDTIGYPEFAKVLGLVGMGNIVVFEANIQ